MAIGICYKSVVVYKINLHNFVIYKVYEFLTCIIRYLLEKLKCHFG